ncbi:acetolactate synthase [compost metagenome]
MLYAESYGAYGHRMESAEDFFPMIQRCIEEPGVHVIDCAVDYSENDFILNSALKERSAAL